MRSDRIAQIILDIPTRALDDSFDYLIPEGIQPEVGCCVLVDFANRPAIGYMVGLSDEPSGDFPPEKLKPIKEVLSTPYFDEQAAQLARWIAREYVAPLSETIRLFTPPGSSPQLKRDENGNWALIHPGIGPVDDRWVRLTEEGRQFEPPRTAVRQRAIIEALKVGEMRVAELSLEITAPAASLKALEKHGIVEIESRRRIRGCAPHLPLVEDTAILTDGQAEALKVIDVVRGQRNGGVVLLDGVTGSGKTEVYLRAIRTVLEEGGSACVLVPEISLTPQTVGRFRARFGEQVAVIHSRLSAGERFDQWDLIRNKTARVVVGARSALFAPLHDLRLVVIDEEHEGTYKQSSSPRYVARDVAVKMAQLRRATVVLGSASPSLETLGRCESGAWACVELPERACGKFLPPVQVVNLSNEFQSGNKTMFSKPLAQALMETIERKEKAVLLLNKRGFASFLLCRDCGYVPECTACSTSLTYHAGRVGTGAQGSAHGDVRGYLMCHHCGGQHPVPAVCPECGSAYLRQLGPGTQFAYDQLRTFLPDGTAIVRMDADSTKGKHGHEKLLEEFAAAESGVLLGTQMIAKGLDFPEVTLVGVLIADTSLKFPDFRAPEKTYQLLEQVAGRAGRGEKDGRVIVQTYWPEHPAIRAAAAHDREILLNDEREVRKELHYPPYARLANVLIWGKNEKEVISQAMQLGICIEAELGDRMIPNLFEGRKPVIGWQVLGPSPCVLAKRQGNHRWHILIKAPVDADIPGVLNPVLKTRKAVKGISVAVDVDPSDML